jgi:hypothetical protein
LYFFSSDWLHPEILPHGSDSRPIETACRVWSLHY